MIFENLSISVDDIPSLNEKEFVPLQAKYKRFLIIRNSLFFIVLLSCLIVFNIFSEEVDSFYMFLAAYSIVGVLWFVSILLVFLGFKHKAYLLRQHDVVYKTGLIFRKTTAVPKNRIQHMEIRQGILLRMFKLSKIVLFTAGGNASDLSISGLKPETAELLKEEIGNKIASYE